MAGIQASYNLYENAKMQIQKKEMKIKERNDEIEDRLYNQSLYKSIDTSVKLYLKKMKSQLNSIFDLFDANNNGKISADEINLDLVTPELLIIFKPLLVEMENFGEDLDREEFVESSLALLEKVDINSRNQGDKNEFENNFDTNWTDTFVGK